MGSSDTRARPAYMHDADENEEPISGTRRTARQKPSVSQRRSKEDKKPRTDTGSESYKHVSSSSKHAHITEKEVKLERRKSSASTKSPSKSQTRPPSAHANKSFPKIAIPTDHPSHYGIATPISKGPPVISQQYPVMAQPIPMRPRAVTAQTFPSRPTSYHAAYSNAPVYHTVPPIAGSAFFQPQLAAPSYPPPSSSSYMRYAATPQPEYFPSQPMPGGRPLSSRFDTIPRTASAFGMRDAPHQLPLHQQLQLEDAYDAGYASASEAKSTRRRTSIRGPSDRALRTKAERDLDAMPPPPPPKPQPLVRPGILRNRTTDYYQDELEPALERRNSRTLYRDTLSSRRPSTQRNSVSYDLPDEVAVRVETANTSHRRRSTGPLYYGQAASNHSTSGTGSSSAWEEQVKAAASYQADVGATAPLTTEMLKRAERRQAGSSRSSGSRDESDYKKSATTRTTRSGSGQEQGADDGFTIKVKGGQAIIMVDGAQIECTDGGEIQVQRQKSIRNGSEWSSSIYGSSQIDDRERRSRHDRQSTRSRKSSVGGHSHYRDVPERHPGRDFTTNWI
ncbi:hypothetical protein B0O99DRAFT_597882 [Bisporella sp. PMI_857]|nr:hypothetical protein B0O99DRAFT_597882 [Bisporella sp. PMI_857]